MLRRNIPNLFTAGNLVGGIMAIIFTLEGRIELAPICILVSALLDFLDGFIARLLKVQSDFGKQMDSLADMVTFGVAPGIMMIEFIKESYRLTSTEGPIYIVYFPLIIPVFALFRLAKFNLDTSQHKHFIGLPTPAMTIFVAALPLIYLDCLQDENSWKFEHALPLLRNPSILLGISFTLSLLMVLKLPLFALKFEHFNFKGNEIRYIFLTISLVLLATLFVWALPIIILLYIVLSLINNTFKKNEIQSRN